MLKEFWKKLRENHILMMVVCCALPLILILILKLLGFKSTWLYTLALFACIGSHLVMMLFMPKDEKSKDKQSCH